MVVFTPYVSFSMEEVTESSFVGSSVDRTEQLNNFRQRSKEILDPKNKSKMLIRSNKFYSCGYLVKEELQRKSSFIIEDKQILGRHTNIQQISLLNDWLREKKEDTYKKISRIEIEIILGPDREYYLSFVGRNRKENKGNSMEITRKIVHNAQFEYGGFTFQCNEINNTNDLNNNFNIKDCNDAKVNNTRDVKETTKGGHDTVIVGEDHVFKEITHKNIKSSLIEYQNYLKLNLLKNQTNELSEFIPEVDKFSGICKNDTTASSGNIQRYYLKISKSKGEAIDLKLGKNTASYDFQHYQLNKTHFRTKLKMLKHWFIDHTTSSHSQNVRVEGIIGPDKDERPTRRNLQVSFPRSMQLFLKKLPEDERSKVFNDCKEKVEKLNKVLRNLFGKDGRHSARFTGASLLLSYDKNANACNVKMIDFANSTIIIGKDKLSEDRRKMYYENNHNQIMIGLNNIIKSLGTVFSPSSFCQTDANLSD